MNKVSRVPPLKVAVMANSGFDPTVGLGTQNLDDKYAIAALEGCKAVPLIMPTLLNQGQINTILDLVDGVILTGDLSNIEPERYGFTGNAESHGPFDGQRDRTAIYLVHAAQERKKPVLGICRGMQEINVAMGGALRTGFVGNAAFPDHSNIQKTQNPEMIYREAHPVTVDLETRLGSAIGKPRVRVNSVHVQAVSKLGKGLRPVAVSDDGIVEAFEHEKDGRMLGVQWHPEYRASDSPVSMAVFSHFAQIMRENLQTAEPAGSERYK